LIVARDASGVCGRAATSLVHLKIDPGTSGAPASAKDRLTGSPFIGLRRIGMSIADELSPPSLFGAYLSCCRFLKDLTRVADPNGM
jgi:hypothetical protein